MIDGTRRDGSESRGYLKKNTKVKTNTKSRDAAIDRGTPPFVDALPTYFLLSRARRLLFSS